MRRIDVSGQRRFMLRFYDEPSSDPFVSITMDVCLEPALAYLDALRREHGEHAGLQHLVTVAVARTLRDMPALNVKIAGGEFFRLDRVDIAVPVRLGGESSGADQTGAVILRDVGSKSVLDVARETREAAVAERDGTARSHGTALGRKIFASAPRVTDAALGLASGVLRHPLGMQLLERWASPSTVVTNVGSVFSLPPGARFRSAAFTLPGRLGHVASAFGLAPAHDAPVAEDGRVVVRRVLPIVMCVDHRAIDGYLMAKLGERLARALLEPSTLG